MLNTLHEPVRRMKFVVLEKYTSADLTNITLTLTLSKLYEKKRDYLLIMYMPNSVFLLVVFISWHILVARPLAFFAVTGVVRVSHLSVIRQRKKAFCAIANIAYHDRLRARQIGGGGKGCSEGNNLDDIRLFVSPRKLFDHDCNLTLYLQF